MRLSKWKNYLKNNNMPLKKAKGKSKAALQSAVSSNIRELKASKTVRPMKQVIAIALTSARGGKKK
jgi:hypothetical protein